MPIVVLGCKWCKDVEILRPALDSFERVIVVSKQEVSLNKACSREAAIQKLGVNESQEAHFMLEDWKDKTSKQKFLRKGCEDQIPPGGRILPHCGDGDIAICTSITFPHL